MENYSDQPVFEYQKEELETARREYKQALNRPWIQRKKGIPHDWIQAPIILIAFGIWVPLIISWFDKYDISSPIYSISTLIMVAVLTYVPEMIYGSKTLTLRHAFKKYPQARRVIRAFQESGEKFRRDLPLLIVDGKKYFIINYYHPNEVKKYGYQKRIGIVLVNESMQVVDNDELFKKVFFVESFSFLTSAAERWKDHLYVRDKFKITNALKQSEKTLLRFKTRFHDHGIGMIYDKLLPSFPMLHEAVNESPAIFVEAHEKARKALGYSFAIEFLYEDAVHLDEVYKAFIRFMNASYKHSLQIIGGHASMLIVSIITEQKRGDKQALLALEKVRIVKDGILGIVERFEREGVIQEEDWEYYHRKVELAHKIGWTIVKE